MKFKVRISAVVERVVEVEAETEVEALSFARLHVKEEELGIQDAVGRVGYDLVPENLVGEELVVDSRGIASSRELITLANKYKRLVITNFYPGKGRCLELILEYVETEEFEKRFTFTEFREKTFLKWFIDKLVFQWLPFEQINTLAIRTGSEFRLPKPIKIWSQGTGSFFNYGYQYAIVAVRYASVVGNQCECKSVAWVRKTELSNSESKGK